MTSLGAVSLTILLGIAAAYGHIFRMYRRRFFLYLALAWLANAAYIAVEAFGPPHETVSAILFVSLVSLPSTFLFYLAWADLRFGRATAGWDLVGWTVVVVMTAFVIPPLHLALRASFVCIVTPIAAFTAFVLVRLGRAIGNLDERGVLALLRGTANAEDTAPTGEPITLNVSPPSDVVLTLGEILSRSIPADALPTPIATPLRTARRLLASTLIMYAALQIAYPFMGAHSLHPLFGAVAFWIAFGVKLIHGAGVVSLLIADLRQVEHVLREKSVAEELGAMTMSIEHDINNPVGNLRREMQTLEKEYQHDGRVQNRIALMKRQVERIRAAADVIPAMREGADVYRHQAHSQNIVWVLREAADSVKRLNASSDVQIVVDATSNDIRISAYPERLQQAFVNILNNGVEACRSRPAAGPPFIRVSCATTKDHRVRVSVRDRGNGILPEIMPRITAPMFSTKSDGKGNRGIGLFIASRIIGYHHGDLQFTSDGRTYTEVTAQFPALR